MTRRRHPLATAGLALACWTGIAQAQVTETPVAFDGAGRMRILTPALVARLGLTPPAWPVEGAFREARLFASNSMLVLAVERTGGTVDRFALPDSGAALRNAVNVALARTGAIASEERAFSVSEPVRGHFLRRQLALAWGLYGPLLASLSDDPQISTAVVLLSVPTSFVIVHGLSRNIEVTRAQSALAYDGAFRGYGVGTAALYVLAGEKPDEKVYRFVGLASALGGSVFGFRRARSFTDGEAQASTTLSTFGALTALGLLGTADALQDGNGRAIVGTLLTAGVAGYAIGPRYARQPSYSATQGDVQLLHIGAILGVMTALTPLIGSNLLDRGGPTVAAFMTAGMLGGMYAAHREWVRPYQHTTGDAAITGLGTTAGALAGMGFVVLAAPSDQVSWAMVTAGTILGSIAGHRAANPARSVASNRTSSVDGPSTQRRASVEFTPGSVALAAAGVPGRHAALTIRF